MKTLFENRIYQVSNIIAVLITAVVPLWVAFTTPSPFSEKRLQVSFPIISDITSVISSSKNREKINISMKINDELISNLVLVICRITNTGDIAIIPSDFYENLSVTVPKEWKILLVTNTTEAAKPVWHKINDQKFEASPELLNPRDSVQVTMYLTNPQYETIPEEKRNEIQPKWATHILNLRHITEEPNPLDEFTGSDAMSKIIPIYIHLSGNAFAVTICGAIFFMITYVNLLYRVGIITVHGWKSVGALIGVSAISLASAEAMATYLFPNALERIMGIDHRFNMPWIVLNLILLIWLSLRAWRVSKVHS